MATTAICLPFAAPLPIIVRKRDVNITVFCALTVILIAGGLTAAAGTSD